MGNRTDDLLDLLLDADKLIAVSGLGEPQFETKTKFEAEKYPPQKPESQAGLTFASLRELSEYFLAAIDGEIRYLAIHELTLTGDACIFQLESKDTNSYAAVVPISLVERKYISSGIWLPRIGSLFRVTRSSSETDTNVQTWATVVEQNPENFLVGAQKGRFYVRIRSVLPNSTKVHLSPKYMSGTLQLQRSILLELKEQIPKDIQQYLLANSEFQPIESGIADDGWLKKYTSWIPSQQLYAAQEAAVKRAISEKFNVIWGGPGTGKTQAVITALIALLRCTEAKLLVVAPHEHTVDSMYRKIPKKYRNLCYRFISGQAIKHGNGIQPEFLISAQFGTTSWFRALGDSPEFRDWEQNYAVGGLDRRGEIYKEMAVFPMLFSKVRIVLCSCSSASSTSLRSFAANYLMVDQANMVTEPEILLLLSRHHHLKSVLLSGDPFQLKPQPSGANEKLERSLLSRLCQRYRRDGKFFPALDRQFRMPLAAFKTCNKIFYGDEIKSSKVSFDSWGLVVRLFREVIGIWNPSRISYLRVPGSFAENGYDGPESKINKQHAACIANFVRELSKMGFKFTLGVICFYESQVQLVKRSIGTHAANGSVAVATPESFSVGESDLVIIDPAKPRQHDRFSSDTFRLNFAVTRAKEAVIILGEFYRIVEDQARKMKALSVKQGEGLGEELRDLLK
ncbi:hypothetical protein ABW19_dt0200182 [Dactylella cylindrospora]|nr:hypothetical protein ABW19_dt0200182 [Dactylella cylindrospora]